MYESLFPYLLGALLAWITWYPARRLEAGLERRYFTAIITIVSLGFIGFPLEDGSLRGTGYELAALVLFLALIVFSRWVVLLLPVVWLAHGAWDLLFLLGQVPVDKPGWVVQLCVPYDWLLAGYLLTRVRAWRGAGAAAGPRVRA